MFFPKSTRCLSCLRSRGLKLGVISNFDRRLYAVFEHLGLTPYFERIIVSSEVGADKPDPAIFRYALDALRVEPGNALHVGDDPERDGGAKAVGMTVFKLDRPQKLACVTCPHFWTKKTCAVQHARLYQSLCGEHTPCWKGLVAQW